MIRNTQTLGAAKLVLTALLGLAMLLSAAPVPKQTPPLRQGFQMRSSYTEKNSTRKRLKVTPLC